MPTDLVSISPQLQRDFWSLSDGNHSIWGEEKRRSEYLAQIGSKGGKASGKARMEKITPEKRSEIAKTAAQARWKKAKKKSVSE